MKNPIIKLLFAFLYVTTTPILLSSCIKEEVNNPINNFEIFWKEFDQKYAQFKVKNIDWNDIYNSYRPLIDEQTTDTELFDIFSEMLKTLNDNHATLFGNGRVFTSGNHHENPMIDFNLDTTITNYVNTPRTIGKDKISYGWLEKNIGYIHIPEFGDISDDIDKILLVLNTASAIIVDIRGNDGGSDHTALNIVNRFADYKRAVLKTRFRNGPKHTDFGQTKTWYISPKGPHQFLRPVILLTNIHTISAGENFALAMKELPHVTQIGSVTAGAFCENIERELLNGWYYTVPCGLYMSKDEICYEGVGIKPKPENIIVNTSENIEQGKDLVLEKAIDFLSSAFVY